MMKILKIFLILLLPLSFIACNKEERNYPKEYEHMYYAFFDYIFKDDGSVTSENSTININRSSADLIPITVKFMSSFVRNYDVDVKLFIQQPDDFYNELFGGNNLDLAIPGIDFILMDSVGNIMTPIREDGTVFYNIRFPQAIKMKQTYYLKMLDNQADPEEKVLYISLAKKKIHGGNSEQEFISTALNTRTLYYSVLSREQSYYKRINIK